MVAVVVVVAVVERESANTKRQDDNENNSSSSNRNGVTVDMENMKIRRRIGERAAGKRGRRSRRSQKEHQETRQQNLLLSLLLLLFPPHRVHVTFTFTSRLVRASSSSAPLVVGSPTTSFFSCSCSCSYCFIHIIKTRRNNS